MIISLFAGLMVRLIYFFMFTFVSATHSFKYDCIANQSVTGMRLGIGCKKFTLLVFAPCSSAKHYMEDLIP